MAARENLLDLLNLSPDTMGIGAEPQTAETIRVGKNITGATASYALRFTGTIQSGVTTSADIVASNPSTAAAAFTVTALRHFLADVGTLGASSAIGSNIGYTVPSSFIDGTANFGFYGDIAAAADRWNYYAPGTAKNHFNGVTLVGTTTDDGVNKLQVSGGLGLANAGTGAFSMGLTHNGTLTANRTLTLDVQNAARTILLAGDVTLTGAFVTSGNNALTLTTTGSTNVTLPTSGTLAKNASDTLTTMTLAGTTTVSGLLDVTNGQVKFPATQNASADANTLDDYEEGNWTPVLTFATPGDLSVTYSSQVGRYTKKGREVTLIFTISTSAFTHTTASGSCNITGLPFANGSAIVCTGTVSWQGITKANYTHVNTFLSTSASLLELRASGSGQSVAAIATGDMPTGGTVVLRGEITYIV